jgi:energy-coupling factor transporter ATP-binding protein EcfA2
MDFFQIKERTTKNGSIEVYPDFKVCRSKDLMIRGKMFYAIWNNETNLWTTDEYEVQQIVDKLLYEYQTKISNRGQVVQVKAMSDFSSNSWSEFRKYINQISDNHHQLDQHLCFADDVVQKKDYVSRKLSYNLYEGSIDAYEELIGTLYEPEEREKLEWVVGAIISGDARNIQKFLVLYGDAGSGKSTFINLVQALFEGYYTTFDASSITKSNNQFATEVFKHNPLVAIQHDGDLSKIEDNSKLNSIISHEEMSMNEKYKSAYSMRTNAFLIMGTNKPVKITDAKSGIIRRLIDVRPSGNTVPNRRYHTLVSQMDFELGAIAQHCLNVYRSLGKNYYSGYKPLAMMLQTDVFFNFIEHQYFTFKEQDGVTLTQAYDMYKQYADDSLIDFKLPKHKFREELKNYFKDYFDITRIADKQVRSYYGGFLHKKLEGSTNDAPKEKPNSLVMDDEGSILDDICSDCQAQLATSTGTPKYAWDNVKTTLKDINTKLLHYVRLQENHIVIDFDLKDEQGNKSLDLNLKAASEWPATYSEISKGGSGIHLHYFYDGDITKLESVFAPNIEILTPVGKKALRRKLTKCNNVEIKVLHGGLPMKGEDKPVVNKDIVYNEKIIRSMIEKNLNKEYHQSTKSSMDFIKQILEEAYSSGIPYDVTDMRKRISIFATNSSNQAKECNKILRELKLKSESISVNHENFKDEQLYFFDAEVFPNLFVLVYKPKGKPAIKLINPTAKELEHLLDLKLVGFNCKRYDNHILYARYIGKTIDELYQVSQDIIHNKKNTMYSEAYNLSYTDIYCFASKKQGLKKYEIEMGIHHMELGLPWDEPVPEELWEKVVEYCVNDVEATEATFDYLSEDWIARQILAELAEMTVNDSTQNLAAKILFGGDRNPQQHFEYVDLSEMFPGYKYEFGKSTYRDEEIGEGGLVRATIGYHTKVKIADVISMHPNSLINMNHFGKYTARFVELVRARIAIKEKRFDDARAMLNGVLIKYLEDVTKIKSLAYSLKIVINIVYGMTSAKFANPFKDPRNVDNIVAKRGALFMVDLYHAARDRGYNPIHIKTDSIKYPNATQEMLDFTIEFGRKYGYEFEIEPAKDNTHAVYEKMVLVNKSTYIAKSQDGWTAVGEQFAVPYVYKTLFTKEELVFEDFCETKSVTTALYLNYTPETNDNMVFVGKVGSFVPVLKGGMLMREKDGSYHAANGTKGHLWELAEIVKATNSFDNIDFSYFDNLCLEAKKEIDKYVPYEEFISDSIDFDDDKLPWD